MAVPASWDGSARRRGRRREVARGHSARAPRDIDRARMKYTGQRKACLRGKSEFSRRTGRGVLPVDPERPLAELCGTWRLGEQTPRELCWHTGHKSRSMTSIPIAVLRASAVAGEWPPRTSERQSSTPVGQPVTISRPAFGSSAGRNVCAEEQMIAQVECLRVANECAAGAAQTQTVPVGVAVWPIALRGSSESSDISTILVMLSRAFCGSWLCDVRRCRLRGECRPRRAAHPRLRWRRRRRHDRLRPSGGRADRPWESCRRMMP